MGKNKQALEYLQKSFRKIEEFYKGDIPEVAAHLGEVLWIMGDKKQARKIWKEGLKEDPVSKILQDTISRLDKK